MGDCVRAQKKVSVKKSAPSREVIIGGPTAVGSGGKRGVLLLPTTLTAMSEADDGSVAQVGREHVVQVDCILKPNFRPIVRVCRG